MKKLFFLSAMLVLLLAGHTFAQSTKEKKISKRYAVSNGDKLAIDNKYGKIHINTWDKNEVTVDVVITVKAKNDDKAQDLLDRINIREQAGGHTISFETEIGSNKVVNTTNTHMQIDYTVNAPKRNALAITNKFGDVYLADQDGALDMTVGYGALKTEKLSGNDKYIKVSFGSALIASLETGKVEVSYSGLTINKAQKIDVTNKFGKSTIGSVNDLKISQQYGDLQLGSVERVSGSVSYAGMDIDKLLKSADMTLKYCGKADFGQIGAGVSMIKVNSSFSSLYYHLDNDASLSADISTSFGNVNNRSKYASLNESKAEGSHTFTRYTGKIGRGAGDMQIKASYGNITFN